jgi:hypothetical protein
VTVAGMKLRVCLTDDLAQCIPQFVALAEKGGGCCD